MDENSTEVDEQTFERAAREGCWDRERSEQTRRLASAWHASKHTGSVRGAWRLLYPTLRFPVSCTTMSTGRCSRSGREGPSRPCASGGSRRDVRLFGVAAGAPLAARAARLADYDQLTNLSRH